MESKKKMLFIFNPFSGKAQIKSKLFEIIDVFVIFLLFRKYSLYIANKRYRGNYFFLLFLK